MLQISCTRGVTFLYPFRIKITILIIYQFCLSRVYTGQLIIDVLHYFDACI